MNWFGILVSDLIAGLLIWGFLEALIEINPLFGRILAFIFFIADYIIYLARGYNFITKFIEFLNANFIN